VNGNIHISSSPSTVAGTIHNIIGSITAGVTGEGSGTGYSSAMTVHTGVTATVGLGDTIDFRSLSTYPLANDGDIEVIPTTVDLGATTLSFGASAMVHSIGCHSLELHGLNGNNGDDTEEIIILNGLTEVETVNKYIRINKMHCQSVGTRGGATYGDVTLSTPDETVLLVMKGFETIDTGTYGHGEAGMGIWTVPNGDVIYLTSVEVNIDSDVKADICLFETEGILRNSSPYLPRRLIWMVTGASGSLNVEFKSYVKIKHKTDIYFRARVNSGSSGIEVKAHFYKSARNAKGK